MKTVIERYNAYCTRCHTLHRQGSLTPTELILGGRTVTIHHLCPRCVDEVDKAVGPSNL